MRKASAGHLSTGWPSNVSDIASSLGALVFAICSECLPGIWSIPGGGPPPESRVEL